jgi:Mycobacterium membrane protein
VILTRLKRLWIALVVLVAVVVGGFAVGRIRGIFGSEKRPSCAHTKIDGTKPFNPKELTYETFGPPVAVAGIGYFDFNADPQRVDGAHFPWSLEVRTTLPAIVLPAIVGNIVAQSDSNTVGSRILVDGACKAESLSHEVNAFTLCRLKAA